ncbi:GntR family transcriptional regulator [Pseudonocardia ailaonensis]|uniref:GntR family transcriptional regulator n=1 Tax=Pseudonocardia ailaonensis TaxID=367279 RepID=A0ABN2N4N0_9PSEU
MALTDEESSAPRVERRSLRDQVAGILRDKILTGDLPADTKVVQSEWAERLGVSRMPVRDAINQLANEGIVKPSRNGTAIVQAINENEIQDGYELNAALSRFAASRAAVRRTEEQLGQLVAIQDDIDTAVSERRLDAASKLNWSFHRLINVSAQSPRLIALLQLLSPSIPHSAFEVIEEWPARAANDHRKIIQALRDQDAAAAGVLVYEHVLAGASAMMTERGRRT